ncbi:MAG TPA: nitroreductase family protein [Chitinophagaceae bacterium]|nr:nitroreductase family protein [Chitinophagaceae bacterium]
MNTIKRAVTQYPVLDIIKNRWSPRSFSGKAIEPADVNAILEAGTWAFSAINEQPWRYIVAHRGTELFNSFFDLLFAGNQPWNKNAATLVISISKKTFANAAINSSALHDVGAANMLLTLQANSMGIYTHIMGGFDKEKSVSLLHLSEDLEPVVMIALGYPDNADKLEEPFKTREITPRTRKPLDEIILNYN